jgi:acetylglutamate kinase
MHKPATPWAAGSTIVVKFGGNAMTPEAEDALFTEVAKLRAAGARVVLVHGGGPAIDAELAAKGITTERIDGQRVTSAQTLAITEAVLCGTINKQLVRALLARGIPAAGVSGQDGALLTCDQRLPKSLGFVGTIRAVAPGMILGFLEAGVVPVIAPLGVAADFSTAYNINADEAAGAIAAGIKADALILITNVDRVRRDELDPTSGIERMTADEALIFADSDACGGSMKPKVRAAAQAVREGVGRSHITQVLEPRLSAGTTIVD